MELKLKSFRSKVARRIFALFIICAILPISVWATISYHHVRKQLHELSQKRLTQESKSIGMSIYERLLLVERELKALSPYIRQRSEISVDYMSGELEENLRRRFISVAVHSGQKDRVSLFGRMRTPRRLTQAEMHHLRAGKTLLYCEPNGHSHASVFMCMPLNARDEKPSLLLGEIDKDYLWEAALARPSRTEICILDDKNGILFSSLPGEISLTPETLGRISQSHAGQLEWKHQESEYFGGFWSVFLSSSFFSPEWVILSGEPKAEVLAPAHAFMRIFPLTIFLTLGMVFLLSASQIRRTTKPIETLKDATRRISEGGFGHKVIIDTGDEFQSLADSFNEMSRKLKEGQVLLLRSAKLTAIGQISAGIVHEVKQPLTAIYGLLKLIESDQREETLKEYLGTILEATERLDGILKKFKSFAHSPSEEKKEDISVHDVIDRILDLLEHQFHIKQVKIDLNIEDALPPIRGNFDRLQQVFLNLLVNALDAFDEKEGERIITIKARSAGSSVIVEVKDNGCGMPEEIQKSIFDPFFTTKGPEQGTGLGMPIVESIIHNHGANIRVESKEGVGTRFVIDFPVPRRDSPEKP